MDYKTIHNYLDDSYPLIEEKEDSIIFRIPETGYNLILVPTIGKLNKNLVDKVVSSISLMIKEDQSHSVAGTYTIDNILRLPDNIFILFQKSETIDLILNIRENRQILMLCFLFNHFEDQSVTNKVLEHVTSFINAFDEFFIFASGIDLTKYLETNLKHDNLSDQIVHRLEALQQKDKDLGNDYEFLLFDGVQNNSKIYMLRSTYKYTDPDERLVEYLKTNHHVLLIDKDSNEIMAKARINGYTKKFAVIGGVEVIKQYRRQGFGYHVSYKITELINDKAGNVDLDTDIGNFPALKIYKRIGFVKVGRHLFMEKGRKVIAAIHGDREY